MRIADTSDLWWKQAVVYCVDVERFLDTDGNGNGDIAGPAERVDHLAELGVTCPWLMPFYPTPNRDDGYDSTDFYGIDQRLGSLGDLGVLVRTARDRGPRVIADLVVNHTPDQHPRFQAARSRTDSPYRDYHVWWEDEPPDTSEKAVFPDKEGGIWTRDGATGHWYLHRFYRHQPDLNLSLPIVAMQDLCLSRARQDAGPLATALKNRPRTPQDAQWASFVRNHDELTLDQLSESEREEVFAAFGPEQRMQVYGRGLMRRLPPMLQGDQQRIRMVCSLVFSLPGTPVLYYGEEIGMGENLDAEGRRAVRTPMQWTSGRNRGFSSADAAELSGPVVEGEFGPANVNVADAERNPDPLLHFVTGLARRYRECTELAWGPAEALGQPPREVPAHRCSGEGSTIVALHNLSTEPTTVSLRLPDVMTTVAGAGQS